jgi:hypothetical protein
MDLWIRSQDREIICKAECVDLMHDTEGYAKVFLNGNFPDLIVAVYENKRALEVLGEIQKLLVGDLLVFTNTDFEEGLADYIKPYKAIAVQDKDNLSPRVEFVHRDCIVYEMPKE